jgi:hypothetical protein
MEFNPGKKEPISPSCNLFRQKSSLSASSIKTRIETSEARLLFYSPCSLSASSIKTRIET